jgi:hypothetical protein
MPCVSIQRWRYGLTKAFRGVSRHLAGVARQFERNGASPCLDGVRRVATPGSILADVRTQSGVIRRDKAEELCKAKRWISLAAARHFVLVPKAQATSDS